MLCIAVNKVEILKPEKLHGVLNGGLDGTVQYPLIVLVAMENWVNVKLKPAVFYVVANGVMNVMIACGKKVVDVRLGIFARSIKVVLA